MDIMDIMDNQFSLEMIIEYISNNFIGLLMLISVFIIIYFVDYINYLNVLAFTVQTPVPIIKHNKPKK